MFFSRYSPVPIHKIGDLIASSGNLQALAHEAQRLKTLEHLLFEALPPALAAASKITALKSGTLVISAENAAIAAKLRQLAPRLVLHFKKGENQITGIQVDVQVKTHKIKAEDDVTKPALPPEAIQKFSQLSEQLPASPLKSALERFAARRGPGKPR